MPWTDRIDRGLNPRDLRVFMVVAEHGNISKAADALTVSRPVISRTIAGLERALGVPLFDRSPHGVEPTIYGRALHKLAITVFDDLRQGMQEIEFLADPTVGELRLGCSDWSAGSVCLAIDQISRRYPRIKFEVLSSDAATLQRELKGRNIELFVSRPSDSLSKEGFEVELLYDDPVVVAADAQHPLVGRRRIELADLISEAWVLPPKDTIGGSYIRDVLQKHGLALTNTIVGAYSPVVQRNLIGTARFLTVMPNSMLKDMGGSHSLRALPVHLPTRQRRIGVIILKERMLSPIAKLFIETLRVVARPPTKAKKGAP